MWQPSEAGGGHLGAQSIQVLFRGRAASVILLNIIPVYSKQHNLGNRLEWYQ